MLLGAAKNATRLLASHMSSSSTAVRPRNDAAFEFIRKLGGPRHFVCAPMVEASELAFRMMVRAHGTTLCYTPMIHAKIFLYVPRTRGGYLSFFLSFFFFFFFPPPGVGRDPSF
jgi:hypothetical protein